MLRYIISSVKVSHSSCVKILELCPEISDSIPKPLQRIWIHSKDVLGFRLESNPASVAVFEEKKTGIVSFSLDLVIFSGGSGLTRSDGRRWESIRKLNPRLLRDVEIPCSARLRALTFLG